MLLQKFFKSKAPNWGKFYGLDHMLEDICQKKLVFFGETHGVPAAINI
jgi:hypothetical protein